ncbi:hypothetical protein [Actinocatenispora comari]|uniref:hypothetical protein n=1 Tax=Actinocatenispora comari TaxID=2807577 RepID=UPI001A90FDC8|nr:hypothetical protein [Actinocatenispora comari]
MPTDAGLAEIVAERIKTYRGTMSAQRLAERCQEIGLQWDRQTIANLESGRRNIVTVGEWLALSYALSVPPLALLLPLGESDSMEAVPDVALHPDLVRRWIEGETPQTTSDRHVTGDVPFYQRAALPLVLYREHYAAQQRVEQANGRVQTKEYTDGADSPAAVEARRQYSDALAALATVHKEMRDRDVLPPRLHRGVVDDMARVGIDTGQIRVGDQGGDDGAR